MPLDVIGSGATRYPVSGTNAERGNRKALAAVINAIRQKNNRKGINQSLLRIRPAEKHLFSPLPPMPNLRSWTGGLIAFLMGASAMPTSMAAIGKGTGAAQSRTRREAAGAAGMDVPTTVAPQPPPASRPMLPLSDHSRIVAALAPVAAASPTSGATRPADRHATPAPLTPDWHTTIDWRVFDKADVGISRRGYFDHLETVYGWLSHGAQADKLPLDIAQFDHAKLERFHADTMSAMGYAASPFLATDPEFLQYLLKRFFLHNAAPSVQSGGDYDADPFTRGLLLSVRHAAPPATGCDSDTGRTAPLPYITTLKAHLKGRFLRNNKMFYPGPIRRRDLKLTWIFEGICQLMEPSLMRRDLPENFQYGSLEWVLLSLGMHLAGDTHWQLRAEELIALAISSDLSGHFAGAAEEASDATGVATRQAVTRLILLMAHAHGKLNLSRPGLTPENVEVAFRLFKEQWSAMIEKSEPLTQCMQRLPKRSEVAQKMLQESGFDAVDRCFGTGIRPRQVIPNLRNLPALCTPAGKKHRMSEVLMMDCLGRNEFGEQLSPEQRGKLASSDLSHALLAERFRREFDAALLPLSREIMLPLLEQRIGKMDSDDARFWHEGEWTVRVPTVVLQSRAMVSQYSGQSYAGEMHMAYGRHEMKGVLVQLALDRNGTRDNHHYWATFHPFELCRYNELDTALLESNIVRFFQPGRTAHSPAVRPDSLSYAVRSGSDKSTLLQSITALLLRSYTPDLLQYAGEITQAETARESRRQARLNLIPLRSSIKAIQSGDLGFTTKLNILFDVVGLVPFFSAGVTLGKAGIGIGKSMTAGQIASAARAALLNRVNKVNAAQAVPLAINIGKPAVDLAIEGVRFFDIGIALSFNLMAGSLRLSATEIRNLKQKFHGVGQATPLRAALDRALLLTQKSYRRDRGFWRMRSDADVRPAGTGYPVFAIGDTGNVMTIREGAGFRLVNPVSGLGYGPLLRRVDSGGKLELTPSKTSGGGHRPLPDMEHGPLPGVAGSPLCRVRRADGNVPACVARDSRIGDNVLYYRPGLVPDEVYQLPLLVPTDVMPPAGRLMVDAGNMRFSISGFSATGRPTDMVPQLPEQSLLSRSRPVLLENTEVKLVSRVNAYGDTVNHLELSNVHTDDRTVTTHYVPFGTYEAMELDPLYWINTELDDIRTEVVGIVYLAPGDPLTAYRFGFQKDRMPLRKNGPVTVQLQPASMDDIDKYRKFQSLIGITQADYLAIVTHAFTLADAGPTLQNRFAAAFQRANTMLDQAQHTFASQPGKVRNICKIMLSLPVSLDNTLKINRVIASARAQISRMRRLMPELRKQSAHFIGFFTDTTGGDTRAAAFPLSLNRNLDLSGINKPLVVFETHYVLRDDVALDNHAATLLHELSHALFGTDDAMIPYGPGVYANSNHENQFTMTPISAAAAQPGSVPENHAPTLEHLIVMAAYADDPQKAHLLGTVFSDAFVAGSAVFPRYWRSGEGHDVKAAAGGIPPLRR